MHLFHLQTSWAKLAFFILFLTVTLIAPETKAGETAKAPSKKQKWSKIYGGDKYETAKALVVDHDGAIIVAGRTNSKGAGRSDISLMKLSSAGTILWDRTFGDDQADRSSAIALFDDGSVIVVGDHLSSKKTQTELIWKEQVIPKTTKENFLAVKVDSNGQKIWEKKWARGLRCELTDVAIKSQKSVLVAGSCKQLSKYVTDDSKYPLEQNAYLAEISKDGDIIWDKFFGGHRFDVFNNIVPRSNGGAYLVGYSTSNAASTPIYIVSIDNNSDILWERNFGSTKFDSGRAGITLNGDLIVLSPTKKDGKHSATAKLLRISEDGELISMSSFCEQALCRPYDIIKLAGSRIAVTGQHIDWDTKKGSAFIKEFDFLGNEISSTTFGENENNSAYSIDKLPDGDLVVAGFNRSTDTGFDMYISRLNK